jgi:hypothetical protein
MDSTDSALDPVALGRVRALIRPTQPPRRLWPPLAAATFAAISALAFATAMITAPPTLSRHIVTTEQ